MQRLFVVLIMAIGLIGAGCSGGDDGPGGLGSEAAQAAAEADIEGIPSGCGPLIAVGETFEESPEQMFTREGLEIYSNVVAEAREVTEGESQATTQYLELVLEATSEVIEQIEADPEMPADEVGLLLFAAAIEREDEIAELEAETLAYLDRRCDGLIDTSGGLTSGGSEDPSSGRPEDTLGEDAIPMEDGGNPQNDQSTAAGAEVPLPDPVLEVETTSVGAAGIYKGLDLEVGEVLRTNQAPNEALGAGGDGTDESWVLVEVRVKNERNGGDITLPIDAFRWIDSAGTSNIAVDALTPQGDVWNRRFPANSSESGYLVFPDVVGPSDGASLEIFSLDETPERVGLDIGAVDRSYPVPLAAGSVGQAALQVTNSCDYTVDTEVRTAQVSLDAASGDRWERAGQGKRFVEVALGMFLTSSGNPGGCFPSIALFQLQPRLELSNGDIVAPLDQNFATVQENSTEVDNLVFAVAEDITSMTLKGPYGEVLAQWDDLDFPQL